jgi:hypothetical protein
MSGAIVPYKFIYLLQSCAHVCPGKLQRSECMVQRRRHGDPHRPGRPQSCGGSDEQLDEEVLRLFATGEMDFDPKLYGLAQCAPDLTPAQCRNCLEALLVVVTTQVLGKRPPWTSAFVVWCSVRYSLSPIYQGLAMLQLAAPPAHPPPPSPEAELRAGKTLNSLFPCIKSHHLSSSQFASSNSSCCSKFMFDA